MLLIFRRTPPLSPLGLALRRYSKLPSLRKQHLLFATTTSLKNGSFKRFASHSTREKVSPKLTQPERVILDIELQERYISYLREAGKLSEEDLTAISGFFNQAIELASGELSKEAYGFVVKFWLTVFREHRGGPALQRILLRSKDKVVNLCVNNLDYVKYVECMGHVPGKEWADTVAQTLRFQVLGKGELQFDSSSIRAFLRGDHDLEAKRRMLATFLRKALLYSLKYDMPKVVSAFFGFANDVGDGNLLLIKPEHAVYRQALALLSFPGEKTSVAAHIQLLGRLLLGTENGDKAVFSNLLTSLMTAIAQKRPQVALEYWKYKAESLVVPKPKVNEFLTLHDLLTAMWALLRKNDYQECLELYPKYPHLHSDQQIDIFLKISEKTKDWQHLQKQFEDMYGRGELPYVQHYSIVMNALASIKVVKEVDELYEQLLRRKLKPTCEIHAAIIKSRLAINDYAGAEEKFEEFLQNYENGAVVQGSVARVHALIFELHFHASTLPRLMKALQEVIDRQKTCTVPLIDTKFLCDVIKTVGANYGVRELEQLWEIAERFSMKTEEVYEKTINALSRFGEYEKADKLTFEAHLESAVPFTSSVIAKAQLKNLRSWYNATTDGEIRPYIAAKAMTIIKGVDLGKFSLNGRSKLLLEAIKFELAINRRGTARAYLDQAITLEGVSEEHYIPFLKYHCNARSYKGASAVLELYREMAGNRIVLTSKTYVYLIKALVEIDRSNSANYVNSYKLLESVFELYGLSLFEHIKPLRASAGDMYYHAENLLRVVTTYVRATTNKNDDAKMDLVVHFLNQMKDRLGNCIPLRFRLAIFKEMGILYRLIGDNETARRLALKALDELNDVAAHYRKGQEESFLEPVLPKLLQLDYRQVYEVLLPVYRELQAPSEEYQRLAQTALTYNVHLAGPIFRPIIEHIMKEEPTESKVRTILDICERFLVAGSWVEVNIEKKQQFIYKLYILFLTRSMPTQRIMDNYVLFNKYYNVRSIDELKEEFKHVGNLAEALQCALDEYGVMTSFTWKVHALVKDPHKFFLPGRSIPSKNVMDHRMSAKIYAYIGKYSLDDRTKAFKLYDDFPDTVEYLLYYGQARTRLQGLRREIDEIRPPPAFSTNEGRKNRRFRTLGALRQSMKLLSH